MILTVCLLISCIIQVNAKHLDKLPESERNRILIEAAREVIDEYAADYMHATKEPVILRMDSNGADYMIKRYQKALERGDPQRIYSRKSGKDVMNGRVFYIVTYPYDKELDYYGGGFAVQVYVWADTHKAFELYAGDGPFLVNLDEKTPKYDQRRVLKHTPQTPVRQN